MRREREKRAGGRKEKGEIEGGQRKGGDREREEIKREPEERGEREMEGGELAGGRGDEGKRGGRREKFYTFYQKCLLRGEEKTNKKSFCSSRPRDLQLFHFILPQTKTHLLSFCKISF